MWRTLGCKSSGNFSRHAKPCVHLNRCAKPPLLPFTFRPSYPTLYTLFSFLASGTIPLFRHPFGSRGDGAPTTLHLARSCSLARSMLSEILATRSDMRASTASSSSNRRYFTIWPCRSPSETGAAGSGVGNCGTPAFITGVRPFEGLRSQRVVATLRHPRTAENQVRSDARQAVANSKWACRAFVRLSAY